MLNYPDINPIALDLGVIQIRWYGLSYLTGILLSWWLLRYRASKAKITLKLAEIDDLIFYATLGIILGGRLGYCLFYKLDQLLADPLWLFRVWEGGMSFHGGFLGVVVAILLYARKINLNIWSIADAVACVAPIGLALGRLANFINGELYGRVAEVPWAMVFPTAPDNLARHPSQLYEMALSGVLMFIILNLLFLAQPRQRILSGTFIMLYGCQRFFVEFFRQPDEHLNFILFDWLTMGQLLSLPMVIVGIVIISTAPKAKREEKKR